MNLPQSWRCEIAAICTLRQCKNASLFSSPTISLSPSPLSHHPPFVMKRYLLSRVDYRRCYKLLLLKEDTESTPPCGAIPQWRSCFWENEARFLVVECRVARPMGREHRSMGSTLHENLNCMRKLVNINKNADLFCGFNKLGACPGYKLFS